ncbi:hypothetical protein CVIRNUC_000212 [Coccomyxa viridis]|uniref:Exostosin GT47 domain-containing protein n=1 Tax=Coccomyxa viridis TaxID=1274662 RepID=A0AAV1HPJ8_9CHLO|nr:hypothetical protein CVIRNUC_000212 [Coccomyxa viridis]
MLFSTSKMRKMLFLTVAGAFFSQAHQLSADESAKSKKSGHPRIYFSEIDSRYSGPTHDIVNGWKHLGELISPDEGIWTSGWQYLDVWWMHQLYMSPHVVWQLEDADIVFVPARFDLFAADIAVTCSDFFTEYAPSNFPALSTKPHVMVASSFALSFANHTCWNHALFSNFTILTSEPYVPKWQHDFSHCVGIPMMGHLHKQHLINSYHHSQNLSVIVASKQRLVFSSYVTRIYATRFAARKHCMNSPHLCKHEEWEDSGIQTLLPKIQKGYEESWFTIMPHADFALRNSLFDALLAPSLPVVFDADFARYMPFSQHIDYRMILAVIDEALFVGDSEDLIRLIHEQYFTRRLDMLRYLLSVRHLFQYKLYPDHHLISFQTRNRLDAEDDAFTFSMKMLLANLCRRKLVSEVRCNSEQD